jgi:hypothetical protein
MKRSGEIEEVGPDRFIILALMVVMMATTMEIRRAG